MALIHAPIGDAAGNLQIDQPFVLDERFAHASARVIATVDRIVPTAELVAGGVVVPGHLVAAVAEVPYGAHPTSCYPGYAYDRAHLAEYLAAVSSGSIEAYRARYIDVGENAYAAAVAPERLSSYDQSLESWQELFR